MSGFLSQDAAGHRKLVIVRGGDRVPTVRDRRHPGPAHRVTSRSSIRAKSEQSRSDWAGSPDRTRTRPASARA